MFEISVSLSPNKTKFGPILFSGDLEKGLEQVSELGYQGVELSLLDSEKVDYRSLSRKLEKLRLRVTTIATGQTYYNEGYSLFSQEENRRMKAVERILGHIELASKLGSMVILGGIRGKLADIGDIESIKKNGKSAIVECLNFAQKKNVVLLLEPINRYETEIINSINEGVRFKEELGYENLKLIPDTFHMNIEENSIEENLVRFIDHIGFIHFADSNRFAPGWGHIDFSKIILKLVEVKYKGAIGIEILPVPDDFSAAQQAINYVKNIIDITINPTKGKRDGRKKKIS